MEHILFDFADTETLPFKWQTLLGSILGVIGALSVALIGFIFNHFYQRYKELRENTRVAEITLAFGLHDLYDIEEHLKDFINRLKKVVILPLRSGVNHNQYFLSETNFPLLAIHSNQSLVKAKYKSYYVHNKILIITKNIRNMNEVLKEMKIKYESIVEKAKFLIERGATMVNQQQEYLRNNESFVSFVESWIGQLKIAKRAFAEAKAYNLKFLTRKYISVWRLEGISFRFFYSRSEIEKYKSTLSCLDRIDRAISSEVDELLVEAENRKNRIEFVESSSASCLQELLKRVINFFISK